MTTTAIDAFIEEWEKRFISFWKEQQERRNSLHKDVNTARKNMEDSGMVKPYFPITSKNASEEYKEAEEAFKSFMQAIGKSGMNILEKYSYNLNHEQKQGKPDYLVELARKEGERKKKQLIARVEKKGGEIVDASSLNIGHDGSLNGFVECTEKNVSVSTIYAGGYNIQCLHYRVLVK